MLSIVLGLFKHSVLETVSVSMIRFKGRKVPIQFFPLEIVNQKHCVDPFEEF
jgi:hypothetical protein